RAAGEGHPPVHHAQPAPRPGPGGTGLILVCAGMRVWAKVSGVPSASRLTVAGVAALLLLGVAGCSGLREANAAGIAGEDVVSELAGQLAAGSALSYTATYRMAGGDTAIVTQAQRPTR